MILGIIQARMGSTRFPGKVLKEVKGRPLLWYLYERLTFSKLIKKVVIATADTKPCLPIVEFARQNKIEYFTGSEDDLIDRLYQTAKKFKGDVIVRVTGDCPLVDPVVTDKVIKFYLDNKDKYDYVANTIRPTYPDGLDVGVAPFRTLERMWKEAKDPFWREWLFSYVVEHPQYYRIGNVENDEDFSYLRWTVDYEEDFLFVSEVFKRLYPRKKDFLMEDILKLLEKESWLSDINKKYKRDSAYYEAKERRLRK